jgi:adenylylsulfate kinase
MDNQKHDLYWHKHSVTVNDRHKMNGYKSCVIWFTGLSASGKSTLANALCKRLHMMGIKSYVLDGDNIRHGLNNNLGFSPEDRKENIRRIGEVAKLFVDAGLIVLTAFISPFRDDRDNARGLLNDGEFVEVYLKCPLKECERRDPKGIYRKVRAGQIANFTGISAPYEEPENPELIVDTENCDLEEASQILLNYLRNKGIVRLQELRHDASNF